MNGKDKTNSFARSIKKLWDLQYEDGLVHGIIKSYKSRKHKATKKTMIQHPLN